MDKKEHELLRRGVENGSGKNSPVLPDGKVQSGENEALALLALACFKEEYDVAKSCLEDHKLKVSEVVDADRRTVLHYCVQNRSIRLAELIIDRDGSLVHAVDANGHTALQLSVIAGNFPLTEYLLQNGANIRHLDNNQHSVTHWAVASQYKDVETFRRFINLFVKYDGDLSCEDGEKATPLHYAAQSSDSDKHKDQMIDCLVSKKVDVNSRDIYDRTPLIWAATTGSEVGCRSLLKAGADVNATDADDITALHCAAAWGHVKCIEILLKEEAIVDSPDVNGCTPLFYSVIHRQPEATKLLIRHKANTNHQDCKGRSVTHCAAAIGATDCLEILRNNKAKMWLQSKKKGNYPLHEAALQSHNNAVRHLLEKCSKDRKKDVDLANNSGRTCLHIAAMTGNFELVDYLVRNDADKNAIMVSRERKMTPYDSAIAKKQLQCADYLLKHGAKSAEEMEKEEEEGKKDEEKDEEDDARDNKAAEEDEQQTEAAEAVVASKEVKPGESKNRKPKDKRKVKENETKIPGKSGNEHKAKGKEQKEVNKAGKGGNGDEEEETGDGALEEAGKVKKRKMETKRNKDGKNKSNDSSSEEEQERKDEAAKRGKPLGKSKIKKEDRKMADKDKSNNNEVKEINRRSQSLNGLGSKKEGERPNQRRGEGTKQRTVRQQPLPPVRRKMFKPYFSLIQEQVRVFEMKRLASLKMQRSLKFEHQGNEKSVVRRLTRNFNEDARPEDRIPSGQFSKVKDFQRHLQEEYLEADEWEKRLKKIEKINPLYDSRPGRQQINGSLYGASPYGPKLLPSIRRPMAAEEDRQRSKERSKGRDERGPKGRHHQSDDDDDSENDSPRYDNDYDNSSGDDDTDNRSNNNGNHGDTVVTKNGFLRITRPKTKEGKDDEHFETDDEIRRARRFRPTEEKTLEHE